MRWTVVGFLAFIVGCAKPLDHSEIRAVLDRQVTAWNHGDLKGFMAGYWKSDDMLFTTPDSAAKGWQATLDRYKKRYPTREQMGTLKFEQLTIAQARPDAANVSGRYHLRTIDGLKTGRFDLSSRRFDGAWLIVKDHTVPDK